jgi:hypothetical protein
VTAMAVHVYGVVRDQTRLPNAVRGRHDALPRLVACDELAAIVTDVSADAPAGRKDLLAHAHVLEAVAEDSTVLPMRFGIVVDGDGEVVERVLRANPLQLQSLLGEFEGLQQLTVKAYHEEEIALRNLLSERPDLRDLIAAGAGSGSYEARVRLGQSVVDGLEGIKQTDATDILEELAPFAHGIRTGPSTAQHRVLDAALLVRRSDRPQLDDTVADLTRSLPPRLRLRYVGPQPPYAFIDAALAGDLAWD